MSDYRHDILGPNGLSASSGTFTMKHTTEEDEGIISIIENGTYNVGPYSSANVDIPIPDPTPAYQITFDPSNEVLKYKNVNDPNSTFTEVTVGELKEAMTAANQSNFLLATEAMGSGVYAAWGNSSYDTATLYYRIYTPWSILDDIDIGLTSYTITSTKTNDEWGPNTVTYQEYREDPAPPVTFAQLVIDASTSNVSGEIYGTFIENEVATSYVTIPAGSRKTLTALLYGGKTTVDLTNFASKENIHLSTINSDPITFISGSTGKYEIRGNGRIEISYESDIF